MTETLLTIYLTGVVTVAMTCLVTDPWHLQHEWHETIFGSVMWPVALPIAFILNVVCSWFERRDDRP